MGGLALPEVGNAVLLGRPAAWNQECSGRSAWHVHCLRCFVEPVVSCPGQSVLASAYFDSVVGLSPRERTLKFNGLFFLLVISTLTY